jgi:stage III sporulation protein AE
MNKFEIIDDQLDEIRTVIENSLPGESTGLMDIALLALQGDLDLSLGAVFSWIFATLFSEVGMLFYLLRHMLIIAILSAFFRAMTESFQNSSISKLGFYICYVLVVALLFRTFAVALGIMTDMTGNITTLLIGSTPIIIGLVASGGFVASAGAFAPILLFASSFFTVFIDRAVVPIFIFAATISLVSYLSEKEGLDKLSKLMQKGIGFGMKSIALIFMAVLGFQRIATPVMNNIAIRGTRTAVASVPVVGQTLSGAIDAVLYYSQAVRGAASAALIVAAVAISVVPILQILAFVVVYKVTAALIAPICDERIVEAIDTTGNYVALSLGMCVLVGFLFVFIVLATLSL